MTHVATTMRAAFERAFLAVPTLSARRSALRRKCGLVTRRTMWSIQRGNR
jgi:hypothetical protein